jgi:tRNA pseudouridine32 synthase/23S rRNA pseudouridine746 synthase
LVQLHPETGRRHQLRLHLASMGHAIVGDVTYAPEALAAAAAAAPRMMLHAKTLELPFKYGPVLVEAPVPFSLDESGPGASAVGPAPTSAPEGAFEAAIDP